MDFASSFIALYVLMALCVVACTIHIYIDAVARLRIHQAVMVPYLARLTEPLGAASLMSGLTRGDEEDEMTKSVR